MDVVPIGAPAARPRAEAPPIEESVGKAVPATPTVDPERYSGTQQDNNHDNPSARHEEDARAQFISNWQETIDCRQSGDPSQGTDSRRWSWSLDEANTPPPSQESPS